MAVSKEVSAQSTTTNSNKYPSVIVKTKYWQGSLVALFFAVILVLNHGLFLNVNADPRLVSQPWLLNNGFIQHQLQLAQKQMDGRTFMMRVGQLAIFSSVPLVGYTLYYLAQGGTVSALLYWPILYNFESGYNDLGKLLPNSSDLLRMLPAFLLIIPFVASIFSRQTAKFWGSAREERLWLLLLLLVSMAFLYPRYSIPHWTVALPFIAVISAYSLNDLLQAQARAETRMVVRSAFAAILVWWILQGILVSWPYWVGSRTQALLKYDPLIELAETLDEKLTTSGPITLLPDDESVSNLYYLLQRPPAFFWVMHYPWFVNKDRWAMAGGCGRGSISNSLVF